MILRVMIAFLSVIFLLSSAAHAEKRVALVIGNGAYMKVQKLDNPKNDAAAMEAMFKAAAFDTVVRVNDLGASAMRRALRDFSDTAHEADIAVVFYAGHGMEVSGINYLIPTDAVLERDIDVQDEAISLDRISQILEPVKRLRFIILDACRDNPFVRSMRRTLATRTVRSGYGEIDEKSLPPNTLVAYAQRAGATAEDGAGANSPYTRALLKHLPTPGLDVELALRRVRDDVLKTTRNRQEPFKYGSLGGTEVALVAAKSSPPAPEAKPSARLSEAAEAWDRTKDTTNIAALEAFISRYQNTYYADLARLRIEEFKKQQVPAAAPPRTPTPAPQVSGNSAAEQKRVADLPVDAKRMQEARAKAEAARQRVALLQKQDAERKQALEEAQKAKKEPDRRNDGTIIAAGSCSEVPAVAADTEPLPSNKVPLIECDRLAATDSDKESVTRGVTWASDIDQRTKALRASLWHAGNGGWRIAGE